MKSLEKRYGKKKAKEIYFGMEGDKNPATSKKAIAKSKKDHPKRYGLEKKEKKVKKKIVSIVDKIKKKKIK